MYFQIEDSNVRLLGSLYLFPHEAPDVPLWVRRAYEWCDSIVLESDSAALLPFFKSTQNASLKDKLPEHLWTALDATWPTTGPFAPLDELAPWAALFAAAALKQRCIEGVEASIVKWATEDSKPIEFLETPEELAASYDAAPLADVQKALEAILADPSSSQQTLVATHRAWLDGDLVRLHTAANAFPLYALPRLRETFFTARNRAWLPKIKNMMDASERTLVIVAAIHLCGAENLIESMRPKIKRVLVSRESGTPSAFLPMTPGL